MVKYLLLCDLSYAKFPNKVRFKSHRETIGRYHAFSQPKPSTHIQSRIAKCHRDLILRDFLINFRKEN